MATNYAIRCGSTGIHLFDRHSGINILCDEVVVPPALWSRSPRQISIALTNTCDLKCNFCYAPKSNAALCSSQVFRWLAELNIHGCLGVGFGGGEPMLHPALPELCEFVTKNTRLAVTITTHGHRITESLAAQLKGNVNFIRVSVDSVGHNYELIRGRSFHQLKEKLDLIRAVSPFGINCVVNSTTVDALHSVAEFAANEGAIELLLIPQHRTKTVSEAEKATIDALHMWIEAYRGTIQLSISEEAAGALPIHMDRTGDNGILSYAHIDAEGRLKRTSYDSLGVPIGERAVLETLDALVRITR